MESLWVYKTNYLEHDYIRLINRRSIFPMAASAAWLKSISSPSVLCLAPNEPERLSNRSENTSLADYEISLFGASGKSLFPFLNSIITFSLRFYSSFYVRGSAQGLFSKIIPSSASINFYYDGNKHFQFPPFYIFIYSPPVLPQTLLDELHKN